MRASKKPIVIDLSTATLILYDGLRRTGKYGVSNLNNFPVEDVERIEIIRGPMSGLYGADTPGNTLGGIAVPGDVIGAEALLFGRYNLSARALASCVLEPWPGTASAVQGKTLLRMLIRVERRAAEILALRCGQPVERIQRLLSLLARPAGACEDEWVALPRSTDIADITSLTQESESRVMAEMKRRGVIRNEGRGIARVRLTDAGVAT